LIACDFYAVDEKMMARLLSMCLLHDYTEADVVRIGRKIWTLVRMINVREGFSRKDDRIPTRISEDTLPEGPAGGRLLSQADFEKMLSEYYELLGWDYEGKPKSESLRVLGLSTIA
jgi:aldehyde:ferredoxin oxidoreductase